jgi:hypothetical protein
MAEGIIQRHQIKVGRGGYGKGLVQRQVRASGAPLLVAAGAGKVHEDPPHQAGANRQEVRPVLPTDAPHPYEA